MPASHQPRLTHTPPASAAANRTDFHQPDRRLSRNRSIHLLCYLDRMTRLLSLLLSAALAFAAQAADISGSWDFKVSSPRGEHTAKLTVTQQGEKIAGSFQSERGDFKVDGAVKGDDVEFSVHYTGGDAPTSIPFRGKLEGAAKMSGRYNAGEAEGNWTATKVATQGS